jgi:hypothetical protein
MVSILKEEKEHEPVVDQVYLCTVLRQKNVFITFTLLYKTKSHSHPITVTDHFTKCVKISFGFVSAYSCITISH